MNDSIIKRDIKNYYGSVSKDIEPLETNVLYYLRDKIRVHDPDDLEEIGEDTSHFPTEEEAARVLEELGHSWFRENEEGALSFVLRKDTI